MTDMLSTILDIRKLKADMQIWGEIAEDKRMQPATRAYYKDKYEGAKLKLKELENTLCSRSSLTSFKLGHVSPRTSNPALTA